MHQQVIYDKWTFTSNEEKNFHDLYDFSIL